jgi:ABC-2 type transport system permease protein
MMGVLQNSFANACSSLLISKYNKTAVDLLMIPLSPLDLTLAYLISSITRGILIAIVTYLTAIIFIDLTIRNFLFTIFSLLMCSGTFAMLGVVLGLKFNDYDQVATIQNFILTPLSFLGGVFYSIKQLPSPFNTVAQFNPITYMINSLRYGILNYKDVNITLAVVVMTLFFSICFITAYKMFESGKGLRP